LFAVVAVVSEVIIFIGVSFPPSPPLSLSLSS
jgi:hypothetical protein